MRLIAYVFLTLVMLLIGAALYLALFDWNQARGLIGREVERRTGRELVIGGDLKVMPFSLHPRVRAQHVTFANADWGEKRPMLDAGAIEFRFSLLRALLDKQLYVTELQLSDGDLLLQREADGRSNWSLKSGPDSGPGRGPEILQLGIEKSHVRVKDKISDTDVDLTVQSNAGDAVYGTNLVAKGRVRGVPLNVKGKSGGLLRLTDTKTPYPVDLEGTLGDARAVAKGHFTGPVGSADLDATMTIQGSDLAPLGEVLKIALPHTKPYKLSGRLERRATLWKFRQFSGKVGASDLGGDFNVETRGERPLLDANLQSKNLDLADLGGFVGLHPGQAEKPSHAPGKVLPSEPYDLEKLRRVDAHVRLVASHFQNDKAPLDNLDAKLDLVDGVFKLDPIVFGVAGGKVDSTLALDARKPTIHTSINTAFRKLRLHELIPGSEKIEQALGAVDGSLALKGPGNSPAAMLGSADGRIDLYSGGGQVSKLALEIANANLAGIARLWLGGDRQVNLNCAVASFAVQQGVAKSNVLLLDTDVTLIGGTGQASLRDETLAFTLTPMAKKASPVSLRGPLHVSGTFAAPKAGLDTAHLAKTAGASVLLGILNPLAAIIPLIDTGPGVDAPCGELLDNVERMSRATQPKVAKGPAKERMN